MHGAGVKFVISSSHLGALHHGVDCAIFQNASMAIHTRWRDSYKQAFRARGGSPFRTLLADAAIRKCVKRLVKIAPKRIHECEEIQAALDDLRILKALCRKYR